MSGTKKILAFLFVALFASYYTCSTFYVHTHQYSWGDVTHSHPYESGSHSHTTGALQLINHLSSITFTFNGIALYLTILLAAKAFFAALGTGNTVCSLIGSNMLRGPPLKAQHTYPAYLLPADRPCLILN